MTSPASFNIVLCLAGAVSAGAYTAGVIDFLLEALDTWESRKISDPNTTPDHRVSLIGVTGASAGGMTAGLMLAELMKREPPVRQAYAGLVSRNRLYNSWVTRIDAKALLELESSGSIPEPVAALLNAERIDSILSEAFAKLDGGRRPTYVAPRFDIELSLSNLAGVPYHGLFRPADREYRLGMLRHADRFRVCVSDSHPTNAGGGLSLRWSEFNPTDRAAQLFRQALLATGAFPLALPPRRLDYQPQERSSLYDRADEQAPGLSREFLTQDDYRFDAVDGGLMNNFPLRFAQEMLNRSLTDAGIDGPVGGALLAVAPFPDGERLGNPAGAGEEPLHLGRALVQILGALKNEARFDPVFLSQALDENNYERFLIAPRRRDPAAPPGSATYLDGEAAIASGGLGGFTGFFAEEFRIHDYVLGRRNAQRFLSENFMLPKSHALFASWASSAHAKHYVREDQKDANKQYLPIIPVMPSLDPEIKANEWPTMNRRQLGDLSRRLGDRLDLLAKPLARTFGANGVGLELVNLAYTLFRKQILAYAKEGVVADLQRRRQIK